MIFKWPGQHTKSIRRMDKRIFLNIAIILLGTLFFLSLLQMDISNHTEEADYNIIPPYILNTVNTTYIYPMDQLSAKDYSTLIDLDHFQFDLMTNCSNSTFLLILIHSAGYNVERRNAIRDTWGSQLNRQIKIIFVVGQVLEQYYQNRLKQEHQAYNDIIQGSFNDCYKNMTYKHTMSLKYQIYHCPQATYILKMDDDVFVNLPSLMNLLTSELSPFGARNLLFCVPLSYSLVNRSFRSKWRVSYKDYSEKYYPTYCPGWALLYSPDVLFTLYEAAQKSKYFWIDDVVFTGILAKQRNILHTNMNPYVLTQNALRYDILENHSYNGSFVFSPPNLSIEQMFSLWNFIRNCTAC